MSKTKGEDLNIKTKLIQFKKNSPYEMNACNMIDKVRYYQSKFIIKLVNDFFEQHQLAMDSPYELIRAVVTSYIDGKQVKPMPKEPMHELPNEDLMTKMFMQQQAMFQQLMTQQILFGPSLSSVLNQENCNMTSPAPTLEKTETTPIEKKEQQVVSNPFVPLSPSSVSNETSYKSVNENNIVLESSIQDFDDIDTDDDYITDLTSAFSNIL